MKQQEQEYVLGTGSSLLDWPETFFDIYLPSLVKIIGQNHQFLGVNNAIASIPTPG